MVTTAERANRRAVTLFDRFTDRVTRIAAGEIVLCAHVLFNPRALNGYEAIALTAPTRCLLNAIIAEPHVARLDPRLVVDETMERAVPGTLALAREVGAATVGDVAACGDLPHVIDMLRDAHLQAALRQRRKAA